MEAAKVQGRGLGEGLPGAGVLRLEGMVQEASRSF